MAWTVLEVKKLNLHELVITNRSHWRQCYQFCLVYRRLNGLFNFPLLFLSPGICLMSGTLPVQRVAIATSSSTDVELHKKNRHWSLMQVTPSSLVGVSDFAMVLCSNNAQPMSIKMVTYISRLIWKSIHMFKYHIFMDDKSWTTLIISFSFHTVNYTGNYTIVNESPLASRTGPPAALYYNFDTLTGLGLMAGSGATNYDPFGPGKVNRSVRPNEYKNAFQWDVYCPLQWTPEGGSL